MIVIREAKRFVYYELNITDRSFDAGGIYFDPVRILLPPRSRGAFADRSNHLFGCSSFLRVLPFRTAYAIFSFAVSKLHQA
jgi:hypothetical protein